MRATIHEPSGGLGLGPVLAPIVVFPATIALATAYGHALVYLRFAGVLSSLLVLVYAAAVAHVVSRVREWGTVKSPGFMLALGAAAGLFAAYAAWAAYVAALLNSHERVGEPMPSYFDLLHRPDVVWRLASFLNVEGAWSIGPVRPSGWLLWALWAVEAALIVGLPVSTIRALVHDQVLCEECQKWCMNDARRPYFAAPVDPAAFEPALDGDPAGLAALAALPEPAEDARTFVSLDLKRCPGCERFRTSILRVAELTVDAGGKQSTTTADLSPRFVVDPATYEQLAALASRSKAPPVEGPPA